MICRVLKWWIECDDALLQRFSSFINELFLVWGMGFVNKRWDGSAFCMGGGGVCLKVFWVGNLI